MSRRAHVMHLLAFALLLTHAAMAKEKKPKPPDPATLAWPPAPAPARVRFVASFHGEDIKGARKQGLLERLAGVEERASRSSLVKPYGVAVDSKGRIFATDSILSVVFVFDLEKKVIAYRGDKAPAALRKPAGVAIDAQDRLFVADAEAHNLTVFNPDGEVLSIFGADDLARPSGVAIDAPLNRLYVADTKARRVAIYDLGDFKLLGWIGTSLFESAAGVDPDKQLASPTALAVDGDGLLYVVDTFLNRVVVFDPDGEFVRRFGDIGQGPGRFMRPRGVAIDRDGHVYVTDAMAHLFQVLTPEGRALLPVGKLGFQIGDFAVPAAIAIDRFDRIVVADQNNRRIQVFRYIPDAEATRSVPPAAASGAK
jgi:DNA-binding beta-propeller fold protein YncE